MNLRVRACVRGSVALLVLLLLLLLVVLVVLVVLGWRCYYSSRRRQHERVCAGACQLSQVWGSAPQRKGKHTVRK